MTGSEVPRSGHCMRDAHDRCPHFAHVDVGTVRRRRDRAEHVMTLCVCDCHAGCPLAGQGSVTRRTWSHRCTCPGTPSVRERQDRLEERRNEVAEVLAALRRETRPTQDEVETRLGAVFLRHGESPPAGLTGWARIVTAGTAPRGTRTPRLLWLGVRAVAGTVRWAWEPASGPSADNRAEARKLYRGVLVLASTATISTAAAIRTARWRRLSSGAVAVLAWLATVWVTSLGTAVEQFARAAEQHPQSDRSGAEPSS